MSAQLVRSEVEAPGVEPGVSMIAPPLPVRKGNIFTSFPDLKVSAWFRVLLIPPAIGAFAGAWYAAMWMFGCTLWLFVQHPHWIGAACTLSLTLLRYLKSRDVSLLTTFDQG